ncbi:mRNA-degrading endonuclease HigB of HigAB toxin-antitoxin module [Citrobacter sp. UYEF32]
MKIISIKALRDFWTTHPDAEQSLKAWHDEVQQAEWKTPADIKSQYRSASILKNRRVVFNIKGNDYRFNCLDCVSTRLGVCEIYRHTS